MRISTQIVVFLIFLNAAAAAMTASGAAADMGFDPAPGADRQVEQANQSAASVEGSGGLGQTLFGLYTTVAQVFRSVFGLIFAGPIMLNNIGVPVWLTTFVFAPAYLIVGADIVYVLTQRDI